MNTYHILTIIDPKRIFIKQFWLYIYETNLNSQVFEKFSGLKIYPSFWKWLNSKKAVISEKHKTNWDVCILILVALSSKKQKEIYIIIYHTIQ